MHWGTGRTGPSHYAAAAGTIERFQIGRSKLLCLHMEVAHSVNLGACNLCIGMHNGSVQKYII